MYFGVNVGVWGEGLTNPAPPPGGLFAHMAVFRIPHLNNDLSFSMFFSTTPPALIRTL